MPSPKLHFKLLFGVDDYTPEKYGRPARSNWRMLCPPPMTVMGYNDIARMYSEEPDKWRLLYRQDLVDRCFTTNQPDLFDERVIHPPFPAKITQNFHRKYGHELFHVQDTTRDRNPDLPNCANIAGFTIDELRSDSPIGYAILQSYEGGVPTDTSETCGWHVLPSTHLNLDQTQEARYLRLQERNDVVPEKRIPSANNQFNQRIVTKRKLLERNWNYTSFPPNAIEIWSVASRYIFEWLQIKITIEDMKMIIYWERINA